MASPPDLQAISLTLCILLTTCTTFLAGTPPNPTPYDSKHQDRMSISVTPRAIITRLSINAFLGLSHALLCLTYPSPPHAICPNISNLSPNLFTWSPNTVLALSIILLGSYIRLSAFSALGTNFTFRLNAPKKLITTGLYSYMQHPSYTGKILIILGNVALLQRPDGVMGCVLPGWLVNATWFWRILGTLFLLAMIRLGRKRVEDEEMMLRNTFGEEWEVWHEKTKRFIPGLF